jgi:hypothetical protein
VSRSMSPVKCPALRRRHTTRSPVEISTDRTVPEMITNPLYG